MWVEEEGRRKKISKRREEALCLWRSGQKYMEGMVVKKIYIYIHVRTHTQSL